MKLLPQFLTDHRKLERFWVILVCVLVLVFGFMEGWFFQLQPDLPFLGNIFLFGLVNLNVILLLLLAYLVLRNIVKLLFERKRNILGHKLRTRLVIAFVGMTLIPTVPLFWLATQFIFSSLDYWFSHQVEESLEQSVKLAKDYLELERRNLTIDCRLIGSELRGGISNDRSASETGIEDLCRPYLEQYHLDAVFLLNSDGQLIGRVQKPDRPSVHRSSLESMVASRRETVEPIVQSITLEDGAEALMAHSVIIPAAGSAVQGGLHLAVLRILPESIAQKLETVSTGYENYLQLKLLHNPLKITNFFTFSIVTLLVIFAAIWFGFLLAKNITVPVQALLLATQRVAEGNLDVQLDSDRRDEVGMLIVSFNKMVRDLREGREQLDSAYAALQGSNAELEDRRRYMEIVLKNTAAGVVSVDASGRIMTMNKSAEEAFGQAWEEVRGRHYSEVLQPSQMEIIDSFMGAYRTSRLPYLEQQVQVMVRNRPMVLLIKASVLRDEQDRYMGIVIVLDDLTDLEKAQRMAAWREVARRIAHEIKNPLTPIQLCAQRLRRKYAELTEAEGSAFDECTQTIIDQVDHMKHLVNEFSKFARLPRVQPTPCSLAQVVEESLALYRHAHQHINFSLDIDGVFPLLKLDRDQFKQVMINLFDNAIHALGGEEGSISIRLSYDSALKIARLECADTGHGLSPEDKLRMFEPYYSTKEKGTGLGLAIVASIVADHNGFARVRDNEPRGTVIVIELPG